MMMALTGGCVQQNVYLWCTQQAHDICMWSYSRLADPWWHTCMLWELTITDDNHYWWEWWHAWWWCALRSEKNKLYNTGSNDIVDGFRARCSHRYRYGNFYPLKTHTCDRYPPHLFMFGFIFELHPCPLTFTPQLQKKESTSTVDILLSTCFL